MHITHTSFAKKFGFVGAGTSLVVAGALLVGGSAGAAPPEKTSGQARASIPGAPVSIPVGGNLIASVVCPAGTVVTGGGGTTTTTRLFLTDSYQNGNGWAVRATNTNTTGNASLTANAVCRQLT